MALVMFVVFGFSGSFILEAIVTVVAHRQENRTWRDSLNIAKRYLKSAAFVRPLLTTYVIFIAVATVSIAVKMRELRMIADGVTRLKSKPTNIVTNPPDPAVVQLKQELREAREENRRIVITFMDSTTGPTKPK